VTLALVLIGLSGSGKSTVAKLAAHRLHLPFVDTDRLIELSAGATVAAVFSSRGEEEFRRVEAAIVASTCSVQQVVATGGGAILRAENRAAMRGGNFVVWLDVPVPVLAHRLAAHVHGEERPLLRGSDVVASLQHLYEERRDLYAQTAHVRYADPLGLTRGSRHAVREVTRIYGEWLATRRDASA
jgi:shikimate kinase